MQRLPAQCDLVCGKIDCRSDLKGSRTIEAGRRRNKANQLDAQHKHSTAEGVTYPSRAGLSSSMATSTLVFCFPRPAPISGRFRCFANSRKPWCGASWNGCGKGYGIAYAARVVWSLPDSLPRQAAGTAIAELKARRCREELRAVISTLGLRIEFSLAAGQRAVRRQAWIAGARCTSHTDRKVLCHIWQINMQTIQAWGQCVEQSEGLYLACCCSKENNTLVCPLNFRA